MSVRLSVRPSIYAEYAGILHVEMVCIKRFHHRYSQDTGVSTPNSRAIFRRGPPNGNVEVQEGIAIFDQYLALSRK